MPLEEQVFNAALGARIRRLRGKKSQQTIADQVGLPRTSLVLVEAGSQRVSAYTLVRLAQVLGVTVPELLGEGEGTAPTAATLPDSTPPGVRAYVSKVQAAAMTTGGGQKP